MYDDEVAATALPCGRRTAAGVKFQVSSDDHRTGPGNTRWSELVLARAAVPPAQIVDPRAIARRA